jgi:hypothetical protein
LKQAHATANANFEPKIVWEGAAVSTGPGKIEEPAKGLEEFDTDN